MKYKNIMEARKSRGSDLKKTRTSKIFCMKIYFPPPPPFATSSYVSRKT